MKVIYMAENILTGETYIGADSKWPKRKQHHQHLAKRGKGFYFHNALAKYGQDAFQWTILETVDNDDLYDRERFWISEKAPAYNLTPGGEGRCMPQKEETKRKISEKLKGNKNGLGGPGLSGKHHSETTKEVISEKMKEARRRNNWSTKKKNGEKIVKGGISDWTKEDRAANAARIGKMFWWNNGIKNVRSETQPDETYTRGRKHEQKEADGRDQHS